LKKTQKKKNEQSRWIQFSFFACLTTTAGVFTFWGSLQIRRRHAQIQFGGCQTGRKM
jgi:hypothetical protein